MFTGFQWNDANVVLSKNCLKRFCDQWTRNPVGFGFAELSFRTTLCVAGRLKHVLQKPFWAKIAQNVSQSCDFTVIFVIDMNV
jgi:hypothetical protein